jgi:REP element-mobilizing transposase RayT
MARKPRLHYPGAVYHVILRGNGKQDVFFEDQDRYRFYLLLQEGVERYRHRVHAFCLMTNHIHLVVQIADIPLSRIMQNLSFRYTRWVNWRHDRSGHLFQGRYKAVLVDGDSYLLELVRYVHLNPVRAKMVPTPEDYPWTSQRAYCGRETLPWLATEPTLAMFSGNKERAIQAFAAFIWDGMAQGRRPEFHGEGAADSRVFGDEEFVERMTGEGRAAAGKISFEDVLMAICRRYSISPGDLARAGKERAAARARSMAAWVVQDVPSVTLRELAARTGRDVSSLSAGAQRLQRRSTAELKLLLEKEELLSQITKCKA